MNEESAPPRKAILLDRDGTLNREQGFVTHPDQLSILPGVPQALAQLSQAGFLLVVITNQSGIARGLYDQSDLARVHEAIHPALGNLPAAYLHCPHHPDPQYQANGTGFGCPCTCRKPGSGLLSQADALFGIDWPASYLIGDSARDLLMGRALPATRILVRSGKPWADQLAQLTSEQCPPHHVVDDLAAAADVVLARA